MLKVEDSEKNLFKRCLAGAYVTEYFLFVPKYIRMSAWFCVTSDGTGLHEFSTTCN